MIDSTRARLAVGIVGTAPAGIAMASALAGAGHLLIGITHTSPADTDRVDAAEQLVKLSHLPHQLKV